MQDSIPTFGADGRRLRSYSLPAVERLLSLSKVVVRRNRRGRITSACFRPTDGANPLRLTALMGTRYSYQQQLDEHRAWSHRRLIQRQDVEALMGEELLDEVEIDVYVRAVFRAVPLSVMRRDPRKTPLDRVPAKVVSIDSGRKPADPYPGERRAA
jgi:hypothetical protein